MSEKKLINKEYGDGLKIAMKIKKTEIENNGTEKKGRIFKRISDLIANGYKYAKRNENGEYVAQTNRPEFSSKSKKKNKRRSQKSESMKEEIVNNGKEISKDIEVDTTVPEPYYTAFRIRCLAINHQIELIRMLRYADYESVTDLNNNVEDLKKYLVENLTNIQEEGTNVKVRNILSAIITKKENLVNDYMSGQLDSSRERKKRLAAAEKSIEERAKRAEMSRKLRKIKNTAPYDPFSDR